jgi:hypothetical protein
LEGLFVLGELFTQQIAGGVGHGPGADLVGHG